MSRGGERGSATLVAVAMMAVMLAIVAGGTLVGSAVIARHQAQAAADLAALAAARWIGSGPQSACTWASSVATANRSRLVACTVAELDVVVTVEVAVALGRLGASSARAAARAGPARTARDLRRRLLHGHPKTQTKAPQKTDAPEEPS